MSAGVAAPPRGRTRAGRVLVIDDSAFFRGLLTEMLEADGHVVLGAADAREALDRLEEAGEPPDLILFDLHLPGLDGWELLGSLRERFSEDRVAILALTEAVATSEDLERLSALGCGGAVNKLAPPDHVRFRVRSVLHPAEQEERRGRRVALSLGMRYRTVGVEQVARTHSLSIDGVFVRGSTAPPIGSLVELRLDLGRPPRTLAILGEVVRSEEGREDEGSPRGFAVRFTGMSPQDRAALAELLETVDSTGL